jgi:hypothetical protein
MGRQKKSGFGQASTPHMKRSPLPELRKKRSPFWIKRKAIAKWITENRKI